MLFIYLLIIGFLAGIVAAIASMASLVSYPGLLVVLDPVTANMTNTAALVATGFGTLASSLKEMKGYWQEMARYAFFQLTGAVIGGYLLLMFPGKVFEKLVPFMVLFSGALLLLSGHKQAEKKPMTPVRKVLNYLGLFIAGIYAGYFGAASGVLTLIFLTALSDSPFVVINAMKSLIGSLANFVALLIFIWHGRINWGVAFPLAIGLFFGGYFGQKMIKYLKPAWVRWITAFFSVLLAIYLGYSAYK